MIFSDDLINALIVVSEYIASDTQGFNDEEIAELCVDAGRMATAGFPEAQEEARALISKFDYGVFLKEAALYVSRY